MQPHDRGLARELDDWVVRRTGRGPGGSRHGRHYIHCGQGVGTGRRASAQTAHGKTESQEAQRKATTTKDKVVSSPPVAKHPKCLKGKVKAAPKSAQVIELEDEPDGNAMDVNPAKAGLNSMDVDAQVGPLSIVPPWTGIKLGLFSED
jgi:hypothetical protein